MNGHIRVALPKALTAVMLKRVGSLSNIFSSCSTHCLSSCPHLWHWWALESGSEWLLYSNIFCG